MKTILFINSCLRNGSRTERLARAYLQIAATPDMQVQEVCLFRLSLSALDETALCRRDQDIAAGRLQGPDYALARAFAAADEIVIAAPFWDASFPAKLKIYFENICVNGITFAYGENGSMVRLCQANRLTYLTTAGGFLGNPPSVRLYLQELCSLFSIPELRFYAAQGLDAFPDRVEELLEQTRQTILSDFQSAKA